MRTKKKIILATLGFQDENKNPISFIKNFQKINNQDGKYKYYIIGNIELNTYKKIQKICKFDKSIIIENKYLEYREYKNYFDKADIIVIPESKNYEYMPSGITWDCFSNKKNFFAPNNALFKFYLNKYKVGYIYKKNNLPDLFKKIKSLKKNSQNEFAKLHHDYSQKQNIKILKKILF
jgi:hypothetical protein